MKEPRMEDKQKLPISAAKIHFLVHPGSLLDGLNKNPEDLRKGHVLFEKYMEVARNLPENEIMVILVHSPSKVFAKDYKAGERDYVKNIKSITDAFEGSPQVIVLTNNTVPFTGWEKESDVEALNKIKSIASKRGYNINPETEVEIFGETRDECVGEALSGIKNASFFKPEKIRIRKELTDIS
jgi:hypothetical protein